MLDLELEAHDDEGAVYCIKGVLVGAVVPCVAEEQWCVLAHVGGGRQQQLVGVQTEETTDGGTAAGNHGSRNGSWEISSVAVCCAAQV